MRILIFAQYFFTAEQAGSARLMELGGRLVGDGHEVTLVTGMIDNATRTLPEEYRGRLRLREKVGGLDLLRVWAYPHYRGSSRGRMLHYLSFDMMAMTALAERGPFDVVLATSPPLFVGLPGWLAAALRRARFVFEVRDLWPLAAVEVGVLREGRALRAAQRLERFLYRKADRLIALTPGIGRYLVNQVGVPRDKVDIVTNGFDPEAFQEMPDAREARRKLGLEGDFLVMLAGTIGPSMKLEILVDAAEKLREHAGIRFVMVGDGDARQFLEDRVNAKGLTNFSFRDPVPRRELATLYAAADVLVVHMSQFYADVALPNRFFDYLAAAKPIVTSGTGDMAEALEVCGSGVVIPPHDVEAMARAILLIRDDYGEYARRAGEHLPEAIRRYSWERVYDRYRAVLQRAAGEQPNGEPVLGGAGGAR